MQPGLCREIKYLNLVMVNDVTTIMEVEPTLQEEIRNGQLEDAKLKEILQLIKENKTSDFTHDSKRILWLRRQICVPNLKHIRELILRQTHDSAHSIHPGSTTMYKDMKTRYSS
jgi:hypothetical protein